jgi:hypothetical protein
MDRMAEKHAREVKIVLDKERVERGGELRQQAKMARQAMAELGKVQREHSALQEHVELMANDHSEMAKTLVRERRLHDVDRQTMYSLT